MRIQNNKGFTLIELMVVISIIGLLSSIVLASLKDARDKANVTKFKAEIGQMISALELYRGDNGKYPYEGESYYYGINNANIYQATNNDDLFSNYLSKYMKTWPKVPANSYVQTEYVWTYRSNSPSNSENNIYRCKDDSYTPKYVILIGSYNPLIFNSFPELNTTEISFNSGTSFIQYRTHKCFSLK